MLSSSRLARGCTPRTYSQRSVATRAAVNADDVIVTDAEAVVEQVTSTAETAIDTVELRFEDLSATTSTRLSETIDKVREFSADAYADAVSSGTGADLAGMDFSGQFASYADKASRMSTEMMRQSSDLAQKLSAIMSDQLETLPEVQAQLAEQLDALRSQAGTALEGATDISEDVSRHLTNEVIPRVSSEIESFTQLAAEGQYADAATSPAGMAAAGLSVLLLGGLVASSTSSSSTSSSSSAPGASSSSANGRPSADAWIAQWRTKNAPQRFSTPTPAPSSSESSSSSSSDDMPDAAAASTNGAYASNGAAPTPNGQGMDMAFAEYISGGESTDNSQAGGWYIASDSEAEDVPYGDVYTSGGNGSGGGSGADGGTGGAGAATKTAPQATAEPAAPAAAPAAASLADDVTDTTSDSEPAATWTTTLEAEMADVEVWYHSGWEAPEIHACVAGGQWMDALMELDAESGAFVWRGTLDLEAVPFDSGAAVEFVVTDGSGDWDKSPDGENYRLFESGAYDLRDGKLTRLG